VREISDIRIACTPKQLPNLTAHAPASSKMGPFGAITVKKLKNFVRRIGRGCNPVLPASVAMDFSRNSLALHQKRAKRINGIIDYPTA
jgi:hypothetical protein